MEIDILLTNARDAVAVEVKSAFRVEDVQEFIDDLQQFRPVFPSYTRHTLYAAVAALDFLEGSDRFAARQGLFVLQPAGGLMTMANPPEFRPRQF